MKTKLFVPSALALTLGFALSSASLSVAASGMNADIVPLENATRTVVIDSSTKWVNAADLETVKFVSNGHEFAVEFDGLRDEFPLNSIAPAGALDHKVEVYVAPSRDDEAGG